MPKCELRLTIANMYPCIHEMHCIAAQNSLQQRFHADCTVVKCPPDA